MNTIEKLEAEAVEAAPKRGDVAPGDHVRVHVRIEEGGKSRIQVFEGTVIGLHRGGSRTTFTVRKVSYGVGVERTFPIHSPWVEKIDVKSHHRVRRAKLYYLRDRVGKATRLDEVKE